VGVDVFFVISGYLISQILFRNFATNTFSLRDFYARRVRRIFPALTIMLIVVLGIGAVVLFPDEYQ
jgi:peptidoglycan/LPS O-acetylase OafA/YrhL